jgi:uncharacterized protein (TIGR01244 family)
MSLLDAARGILNASSPLPWLVVSGQPSEDQLASLKAAGVQTVIDLRDEMEPRPLDERAAVKSLGLNYVNAPVISGSLRDAAMDAVIAAMRAARGTPTLLHCNSANRTGAPLIAYLMIDEGMSEQDAIDTGMRSGLRSVELMEWATNYARSRKG